MQGTENTNMGLRASLYSSLATKAAEWVFKSDGKGAEIPWGCSASESWQRKGVAKQVGGTLTCSGPPDAKDI